MLFLRNIFIFLMISLVSLNVSKQAIGITVAGCEIRLAPPLKVTLGLFLLNLVPFPDCQYGTFFALNDGSGNENFFCTTNTLLIITSSLAAANTASCYTYTKTYASAKANPYTTSFAESIAKAAEELAFHATYAASITVALQTLHATAALQAIRVTVCQVEKNDVWPAAYPDSHIKELLIKSGEEPTVENIVDKYNKICLYDSYTGNRKWLEYEECWIVDGVHHCAYGPENLDASIMICTRTSSTCPCAINSDFGMLGKPNYARDSHGVIKTNKSYQNGVSKNTLIIKDDGTFLKRSADYYTSHAGRHCRVLRTIARAPLTPSYTGIIDDVCNTWSGYSKNRITLTAGVVQCVTNTMRNLFEKPMPGTNIGVVLTDTQNIQYNQYTNDIKVVNNALLTAENINNNTQANEYSMAQDLLSLNLLITQINDRSLFGELTGRTYTLSVETIDDKYQSYIDLSRQIEAQLIIISNLQNKISDESELQKKVCILDNRISGYQTMLNSCFDYTKSQASTSYPCSFASHNDLLRTYGIWDAASCNSLGSLDSSYYFLVNNFPNNYLIYTSVDNYGTLSINDGPNIALQSFAANTSAQAITLINGVNKISINATNSGGPAGYAVLITDTNGTVIFNTRSAINNIIDSGVFNNCNSNSLYCSSVCKNNVNDSNFQRGYNNIVLQINNTKQALSLLGNKSCAQLTDDLIQDRKKLDDAEKLLIQYKNQLNKIPSDFYDNLNRVTHDLTNLLSEIINNQNQFMANALSANSKVGYTPFQSLQGAVMGFVLLLFVFFISYIGYRMITGELSANISDFLPLLIDIALVYYFAIGGAWKDWLINFVANSANSLGQLALEIPLNVIGNSDKCQYYQNYYIQDPSKKICDFTNPNGSIELQTVAYDPRTGQDVQGCIKGPYLPAPQYEKVYKPVVYGVLNKYGAVEKVWLPVYCKNDNDSTKFLLADIATNQITGDYTMLSCREGYTMEDGYRVSELRKMGISDPNLSTDSSGVVHTAIEIAGQNGAIINVIESIQNDSLKVITANNKYKNQVFMESIRAFVNKIQRHYPVVHQYGVYRDMSYVAMFDTLDCKIMHYFGYTPDDTEDVIYVKFVIGLLVAFPFGWVIGILLFVFAIILLSMLGKLTQSYIVSMSTLMILLFMSPMIFPLKLFPQTKGYFDEWVKKVTGYLANIPISMLIIGLMIVISDYTIYGPASQYVANNVFNPDGTINTHCANNSNLSTSPLVCLAYYFSNNIQWVGITASPVMFPAPNVPGEFYGIIFKSLIVGVGIAAAMMYAMDILDGVLLGAGGGGDTKLNASMFNSNSGLASQAFARIGATAKLAVDIPSDITSKAKTTIKDVGKATVDAYNNKDNQK